MKKQLSWLGLISAIPLIYLSVATKELPEFFEKNPSENTDAWFSQDAEIIFLDEKNEKNTEIQVEIADTPEKRAEGLMFIDSMEENHGMLFVFEEVNEISFWMKNTLIPLDIIFVNENLEIIHIHENATPESEKLIYSQKPIKYVIEVNGGFTNSRDIKIGHKIKILEN